MPVKKKNRRKKLKQINPLVTEDYGFVVDWKKTEVHHSVYFFFFFLRIFRGLIGSHKSYFSTKALRDYFLRRFLCSLTFILVWRGVKWSVAKEILFSTEEMENIRFYMKMDKNEVLFCGFDVALGWSVREKR